MFKFTVVEAVFRLVLLLFLTVVVFNAGSILFTVRDGKVRRSVERIFTIWEERSVYSEELISQLRVNLNKREKEREKQKEKEKEKQKEKETPPPNGPFITAD